MSSESTTHGYAMLERTLQRRVERERCENKQVQQENEPSAASRDTKQQSRTHRL
jgi:hypothetical protein